MSEQEFAEQFAERFSPKSGRSDEERYVDFIDEVLGVELSEAQEEMIRTSAENQYVGVQSANGSGKSFAMACYALAYLYCNPDAIVMITSASYSTMSDTLFRPLSQLLREAKERVPLPGKTLKAPPRIEFEDKDDQFLKCISTSNPKDLEGRHGEYILVIVEECDSHKVDADVIDSAESSITGSKDRMVAIGNPPMSKGNSFHRLMSDPEWEHLYYSSFDSRNVKVELGEHDGPKLPGLAELSKIEHDWRSFNREEWVGAEAARESEERSNLDERWFRRRLGVVPPADSSSARPFYVHQVDAAVERWQEPENIVEFDVIGIDLATSGGTDSTIAVGIAENRCEVVHDVSSPSGRQNAEIIRTAQDSAQSVVVDAIGNTNFIENLDTNPVMFKGSNTASDEDTYYRRRAESYFMIGKFLDEGGMLDDDDLVSELYDVAEVCEAHTKSLKGGDTYQITPKDDIKKYIDGDSPDYVDALSMACWQLLAGDMSRQVEPRFGQKDLFA